MRQVREGTPVFTIVHGSEGLTNNIDGSSNSHGRSLLDEIVREGAQRMLAVALQAEVAAYVEAHAGEVDERGRRLVLRNGHHNSREVVTAAGAVQVRQPRVNDKRVDPQVVRARRPGWAPVAASTAPTVPRGCGSHG